MSVGRNTKFHKGDIVEYIPTGEYAVVEHYDYIVSKNENYNMDGYRIKFEWSSLSNVKEDNLRLLRSYTDGVSLQEFIYLKGIVEPDV